MGQEKPQSRISYKRVPPGIFHGMSFKIPSFTLIYIILFKVWSTCMFIFRKPMVNFLLTFTQDLLEQTESENLYFFGFPMQKGLDSNQSQTPITWS